MNRFAYGALVLGTTSAIALGNNPAEDWSSLDREIETLAASTLDNHEGFGVSGYLMSRYANSSDITVGGNDLGGWNVDFARVELSGSVGDYGLFVSVDAAGGTAVLFDAFATFAVGENITGTWGQFRIPLLWSALIPDTRLLFLDRTVEGTSWYGRNVTTQGIMLNGGMEQINWYVAVQNGSDGAGDELALTGRVTFNAIGEGVGNQEGAYGAGQETNATVGIGYHDDGAIDDGTALAIEGMATMGQIFVHAEIVDLDTGFGDATPFSVTGSYAIDERYEAGLRFEDLDDANDTSHIGVVVNRYISGHDAKWVLQYDTVDSDAGDFDVLSLGLVVSV